MTAITPAERETLRVLTECGYPAPEPGREFSGNSGWTSACWQAAKLLAAGGSNRRGLVLALNSMDNESGHTITLYSNLGAVTADADDYSAARQRKANGATAAVKEMAEARHAKRELAALEEMVAPDDARAALRRRVLTALADGGVRLAETLWCARELAGLIQSERVFQSVKDRKPEQGLINQPYHDDVVARLRSHGL